MNRLFQLAVFAGMAALGAAPATLAADRPIVVELFTSQGCSSCPPADALLSELAMRKDVLALGFHVDYWDSLGWKDPLSTPGSTARQHAYAAQFGKHEVYTPQMVVDGRRQLVGSRRSDVLQAIAEAQPGAVAPVVFAADGGSVSVGAGQGAGNILVIRFVRDRTTTVPRGENAGSTAHDVNAVENFKTTGRWTGTPLSLPVEPPASGHGVAVLIQSDDGRILGAAAFSAPMG